MAPPGDQRLAAVVVIRIIILRHLDRQAGVFIPQVFFLQRAGVVFAVAHDEDLLAVFGNHGIDACLLRGSQNLQLVAGFDILPKNGGMAAVGGHENIVKAAEQDIVLPLRLMGKHAEEFLLQRDLLDAVMIIQPRLGAPADVEGGMNVFLAPFHDGAELLPVFHLFKGKMLHRCAGDDHAVEVLVLDFGESFIERGKMFFGCIL